MLFIYHNLDRQDFRIHRENTLKNLLEITFLYNSLTIMIFFKRNEKHEGLWHSFCRNFP